MFDCLIPDTNLCVKPTYTVPTYIPCPLMPTYTWPYLPLYIDLQVPLMLIYRCEAARFYNTNILISKVPLMSLHLCGVRPPYAHHQALHAPIPRLHIHYCRASHQLEPQKSSSSGLTSAICYVGGRRGLQG